MFGTLQARADQLVVTRFRTRRVGLLLAYLALMRHRVHHREEIAELLWPDQDPETTARNLRQALFSLRRALEPPSLGSAGILIAKQSTLQLNSSLVATDVAEFEALVAQGSSQIEPHAQLEALKSATALYTGELLPGFYDDWIQSERLRLEDLYVYAVRRLIDLCEAVGFDEESILYLRLVLAKEPLNEEWHVRLMEKYLATGRPSSALKQFRDLEQYLAEQLNCEPSVEAKRLGRKAEAVSGSQGTGVLSESPRKADKIQAPPVPAQSEEEGESTQFSRLPAQLTQFYGRGIEIEDTLDLFRTKDARLVTIVGPAGVGKTRLSLEVGRTLAEDFGWNVWFVPLADLVSADMLADAVLDALKARDAGSGGWIENVGAAVKGQKNLIMLDNLEHIIEHAAPQVLELVRQIPQCRVLVTSRQALKTEEEWEVGLAPLPLPPTEPESLAHQLQNASVQLFVDRCQRIRPDFQLTKNNAGHISRICSQLEGLPLALEIAAAMSNSFAPAQMVQHLQNRLTALSSRRRDISERHRSLRAAIDYSYELLKPDLRRFFTALCVFRGGFSIESAYEVSYRWAKAQPDKMGRRNPHEACLAAILELQDRSLLSADSVYDDSELRFRMLEAFREYGEDR